MKVLIICLALAAVSFAMPVAEDKQDTPVAVAEVKSGEDKVQNDAQPAKPEEKKEDPEPAEKDTSAPIEAGAKSASSTIEAAVDSKPVVKEEDKESKKDEIPKVKSEDPAKDIPKEETKPQEKSENPESQPQSESKPDESQAKVEEVGNEPSVKSAVIEEAIDIVNAIKNPAAVADDVVDAAAINPIAETHTAITTKSAEPEDKKVDTSEPKAAVAKSGNVEENASVEPKPEDKKEEPAAKLSPPETPIEPKSGDAGVTGDSQRVVRDAVEENQAVAEATKEEPKSADVAKVEDKPSEVQISVKSAESSEESKEKEDKAEVKKDEIVQEPAQPMKETGEANPALKEGELPLNDPAEDSSEESSESLENSKDKDSSKESADKTEKSSAASSS